MTDTAPPLAPPSVADFHPAPEPSEETAGSHPRRGFLALPVLAVAAAAAACTPQQVEDWKRAVEDGKPAAQKRRTNGEDTNVPDIAFRWRPGRSGSNERPSSDPALQTTR